MTGHYNDTQRMELRSYVNLAGEVIAPLWPMRTFISRNPLQGFEHLPFEEAVRRGEQFFGGRGYLSLDWYRNEWRNGRIAASCIEAVLQPIVTHNHVQFSDRRLTHLQVLQAAMTQGIVVPPEFDTTVADCQCPDVDRYVTWAEAVLPKVWHKDSENASCVVSDEWPYLETAASWCDRTIGTTLCEQINREMIKWLAAFCDEGEAAWGMPHRDRTFFRSWKSLAQHDRSLRLIDIKEAAKKIRALPDRPDDALLQSLDELKIPPPARQNYLSLHLAALPGWAGFIKWRADQTAYPWQESYRIDLVKYLAVRLFYERELVARACDKHLGRVGNVESLQGYARSFPHALWFLRALHAGRLPQSALEEARRLRRWSQHVDAPSWEEIGKRWHARLQADGERQILKLHACALIRLAESIDMNPNVLLDSPPSDVAMILHWLRSFPARVQHLKWLEAHEQTHEQELLKKLARCSSTPESAGEPRTRPLAQFAFCIDVRSEVFRRHLEQRGGYETFGFAGFFGLPVAFRPLDEPHEFDLCPVLLKPRHMLREVPRAYDGQTAQRRKVTQQAAKMGRELLHDLKHNVVTPYVMVEAVGWLFCWPLLGRTLFPGWYDRLSTWLTHRIFPKVATTLTVDKLTSAEADEMIAVDQRRRILQWLRTHHHVDGALLTPDRLERIRLQALDRAPSLSVTPGELGHLLAIPKAHEARLLEELRRDCGVSPHDMASRIDRITRTGFTSNEQAYYVETALKLMGFTGTFSRLVFLCGHGSTSQNNPYESALDCGACGGSSGLPNARAFATIANRPHVRALLAKRGIVIPSDTHFVAALHDTTTDRLSIADVQDVPATHRKELAQVLEDLNQTTTETAMERLHRLERSSWSGKASLRATNRRSGDWAEVRPEWGLAKNGFFIIGSRRLTRGMDLEGRSFLHSYDHRIDQDGKLLEVIMTAPLIVAQWINSEYYFSTVAPEVYGSGSKVYHNVTGRIGVMAGNRSDLRMGLPVQSVFNGTAPYHEPLRLTAVVEAPRQLVAAIIARQTLLQQLFNNRWVRLVVLEPGETAYYRYVDRDWLKVSGEPSAATTGLALHN